MYKNMPKRNMMIVVVVLLVVVLFGFWHYKQRNPDQYSVVYLTTGEVYVGKLTVFHDLDLKDGYILQVTKDTTDPTKNNFQLNPISQALWAPQVLHITRKNVVFYGPLMPESKIAQTIAAQKK